MILVIGSSSDHVYPQLVEALRKCGSPFAVVDEDQPDSYQIQASKNNCRPTFRIFGGECQGSRAVSVVFVRHAVARTLDPTCLERLGALQTAVNHLLFLARCPVINRPEKAYSNYAKPYQLGLLAAAGFDVPRTLVTNCPIEARRFYRQCRGRVIVKGVSNVTSLAEVWRAKHWRRLRLLPHSPTQFQEYVEGADYRVHVIGTKTFVTRLLSRDEDYRRAALLNEEVIRAEPAQLPTSLLAQCVQVTGQMGLIVSGIDFKQGRNGRLVALELNPFPQFTFYEGRSGQPITASLVQYLLSQQKRDRCVLA